MYTPKTDQMAVLYIDVTVRAGVCVLERWF